MGDMNLYSENECYKLYQGNMLDMLDVIDENSIDAIITDPPYELNFMSKGWDNSGIAFQKAAWEKCYKVLKPGGYLLAFGGSRTFHRIACAIEDAGFEIRDTIMWLYGSGFPKSLNIGLAIDKRNGVESKVIGKAKSGNPDTHTRTMESIKPTGREVFGGEYNIREAQNEWNGWGSALKPSYEPIIMARKRFDGSLVDNVIAYGVGGINIDECRIGNEKRFNAPTKVGCGRIYYWHTNTSPNDDYQGTTTCGRFPANTILTYDDTDFKEVCGGFPNTTSSYNADGKHEQEIHRQNEDVLKYGYKERIDSSSYNDNGSAARYFYCAKASSKDRDSGLSDFEEKKFSMMASNQNIDKDGNFTGMLAGRETTRKNIHPTVKPVELMQYLIRLVCPKGSTILDCFNGSGSTGKAVIYENSERNKEYKYIGIELSEEYLPIAQARIESALKESKQTVLF